MSARREIKISVWPHENDARVARWEVIDEQGEPGNRTKGSGVCPFPIVSKVVSEVVKGIEFKSPIDHKKFSEDPELIATVADLIRQADGRPRWSTENLPGADAARSIAVLRFMDSIIAARRG